ncbi:succinate dehydrogenase (ubiquinone) membrane anchor subunit, partial [Phenoliferia sp. Uapishka_3]
MSFSRSLQPALRLANARAFHAGRVVAVKAAPVAQSSVSVGKYIEGTVNDPIVFPVRSRIPINNWFCRSVRHSTDPGFFVLKAPDKSHGSYHWTFERVLSAALVPLVGATAVTSVNPVLDGILSVALVVHSHIVCYFLKPGQVGNGENFDKGGWLTTAFLLRDMQGFDSIFTDYLHPRKFPVLGAIAKWGVRLATGGVLVGVYQFNTNDIGMTELLKKIWKA